MTCLIIERFQILEKFGPMTATDLARRMSISVGTARTWLSRMTNYKRPEGGRRHYLLYDPPAKRLPRRRNGRAPTEGTYRVNPDPNCEWSEMYNDFA